MDDIEILLDMAELEHIRRARQYDERLARERRYREHLERVRLRALIAALMVAPFSWQQPTSSKVKHDSEDLYRDPHAVHEVAR